MNWYKENNCRLCKKVFCCKKCREKHESLVHKIFPGCNICIYGKTFFGEVPPQPLIDHVKNQHWPLHCVVCKKVFESLEELLKPAKCNKSQDFKTPYTPIHIQNDSNIESPPYFPAGLVATNTTMFSNLATSTPMQREENIASEKCKQETTTPVEFSDIDKDTKYFKCEKRKVTFCETPITENYKQKTTTKSSEDSFKDHMITPSSGNASAAFYSAKQSLQENSTPPQVITEEIELKTKEFEHDGSSLWMSAINASPALEENQLLVGLNSTTPVLSKVKKRQVNVVLPISVRRDSINLDSPVDLNNPQSEENASEQQDTNKSNELPQKTTTFDASAILSETSANIPSRLWTGMSRLVKNVTNAVQELSVPGCSSRTPLKRSFIYQDPLDEPHRKRYKLTKIKCRPPIRESAILEFPVESFSRSSDIIIVRNKKTFSDKATQTD